MALAAALLATPAAGATAPAAAETAAAPAAAAAPVVAGNPELLARLAGNTVVVAGERLDVQRLRRFYAGHANQTVWDQRPAPAKALWQAVLNAEDQALDPALFHGAAGDRLAGLSLVERDLLYSDAFLSYAAALSQGDMPAADRSKIETLTPPPVDVVAALDKAMTASDAAAAIAALAPSSPEYQAMRRAYAEYRAIVAAHAAIPVPEPQGRYRRGRHAPEISGRLLAERRLQQLAVNLERLRWLPREMPADRIMVNTAIQRLQLFHGGQAVFETRVVVGQPSKQTPEFQAVVTSVLFNPPWYVPRSILEREILPKLAEDSDYLEQHHMRFRNAWSVEQLPGPDAALGQLKFEMPNRFDVYLHDTPQKSFFRRERRMLSHGCVRVQNPRELAALVLDEDPEAIGKAIAVGYTHRVMLKAPLPVYITYRTAFAAPDGTIRFEADPYQRDDEIWQWLNRAQHEPIAQESASSQRKG